MPLRMRKVIRLGPPAALAANVLVAVLLGGCSPAASLEFSVRDAQSGGWVWDMTARLQNRYLTGYYQSDAGPKPFRFTELAPGDAVLDLSAPDYQPRLVPVHLKPGQNRLESPIFLQGLEIPGLDHFLAFETPHGSDLVVQLRPVTAAGKAILNHPCLPLWVAAEVYVEVKDGAPVRDDLEQGSGRGRLLFRGPLEWRWDPTPETQFRYSAVLPGAAVTPDPAPLRVVDYLVVVADPLKASPGELAAVMGEIWSMPPSERAAALKGHADRLRAFTDTSWNVKGGGA